MENLCALAGTSHVAFTLVVLTTSRQWKWMKTGHDNAGDALCDALQQAPRHTLLLRHYSNLAMLTDMLTFVPLYTPL